MASRGYPTAASCHALVLFGLLLTVTSLDRVWRVYSDATATGWDALGGLEALVIVPFVLAVVFVVADALALRGARPTWARVAEWALGVALVVALVSIVIAFNDESPAVFDGQQADDHPHGAAYAALGGVVVVLAGWAGLAWSAHAGD